MPIMKILTTGNIVKHLVQYLNYEVDIINIIIYHWHTICKLSYQSNRINQNY